MSGLSIGYYYHIPAKIIDGSIHTAGPQGCFIDSLAAQCERIYCFLYSPRESELDTLDYRIQAANVELVDIGPHSSVLNVMFNARAFTRSLREYLPKLNVVFLRGPSPLLPQMAEAAGHTPVVLLLVGNYLTNIDNLPQPRWRKEAIRYWAMWNQWGERNIARRCLTFVNSRELYRDLEPISRQLIEIRTTTLRLEDFHQRDDTCEGPPYRLLYTGRMDRTKGLFEIVEAVSLLVSQGVDVTLDLVGAPIRNDPILEELKTFALENGIDDCVHYLGFKPLGPELFSCYKNADIYLTASISSEGFPRTLWEAMSHGTPVVTTRVGSIPYYLTDKQTAILVAPKSAYELSEAVKLLITDQTLRRNIIQNAYALVKENTLERRAGELVDHIKSFLAN
ncbi:MAG: glycosyltransferase [Chloroflexi bacterium]|nr:glycosyltransferase [Chloroflexota bacterium]